MKIRQLLLPLQFPKKKAVQMTFRFNGHPPIPGKAEPVPQPKPTGKGKKLDLFM